MNSPLSGYYGGKGRMASGIADIIQGEKWTTYAEPFCGGASVFFHLAKGGERGFVLNDRDGRLVNFWMVCRNKPDALLEFISSRGISSRELHERARKYFAECEGITYESEDIELAWALWYLIRLSFSGLTHGQMRRCPNDSHSVLRGFYSKIDGLADALSHLTFAVIEQDDAIGIIQKYDRPTTIFYVDPPYVNANQSHYSGYTQADLDALLEACLGMQGKFVLSHYDNKQITDLAKQHGWHIIEIETVCNIKNELASYGDKNKRTEIIVCNFNPDGKLL